MRSNYSGKSAALSVHGHGGRRSGHSNTATMASAKINKRTHGPKLASANFRNRSQISEKLLKRAQAVGISDHMAREPLTQCGSPKSSGLKVKGDPDQCLYPSSTMASVGSGS